VEPKDDAKLEPVVTTYEGMEAANRGLEQFQRKHAAHRKEQEVVSDKLLVTRCLDCDAEFREHYTPAKP
jgi:hypothetical protein